jgi:exonuclease VII small subunit
MKSKNIPVNAKSKSIKEIKEEINHILEKLENNETNLSESTDDYQKLIHLNKLLEVHFRKRAKEISAIGKKKSKE